MNHFQNNNVKQKNFHKDPYHGVKFFHRPKEKLVNTSSNVLHSGPQGARMTIKKYAPTADIERTLNSITNLFGGIFKQSKDGSKFYPGVARMYVNHEFDDKSLIPTFVSKVNAIVKDEINNYDEDLNGLSATQIINAAPKKSTSPQLKESYLRKLVNFYLK